jgi:S1-C subfamily serine protease
MSSLNDLSNQLAGAVADAGSSVLRLRGTRTPACATAWTKDTAVTVAHALGRREKGQVVLPNGEPAEAEILAIDRSTDLALLRVDAELALPVWADEPPRVGELVLALGRGRDGSSRANLGMVSGVSGAWKTRGGGKIDHYIEIDGTLGNGLSGGPLARADGRLLGINSHRLVRSGVTIPSSTVSRVVGHLQKHGGYRRGFLGVGVQSVHLPLAFAEELGRTRGVLVTSVKPDGPADGGGVLLGDVILALDEVPVEGLEDLRGALSDRAGERAKLHLLRAGAKREVEVEVGAIG